MRSCLAKNHVFALPFNRGEVAAVEYSDETRLCSSPMVSVITTTYLHEKYLSQAIEGVLAQQKNFEIELIIGEDCSPDGTLKIALDYQRRHPDIVRVVTSEANVGARQNGYRCGKLCRGRYVAFCDGDDYWHDPKKLQKQVEYLETHPECGLVFTNADTVEVAGGKRVPCAIPYFPALCDSDDPYLQQLTGAWIIWPVTVCLRRELREEVIRDCFEATDPRYLMGDTQRYLEYARRTSFCYMPVSTATRQLLPESTTRSQDVGRKGRFVASQTELILHYLEKYPIPERYDRQVRRWIMLRELEFAFRCRDAKRAAIAYSSLCERSIPVSWRYRLYYHGALNSFSRLFANSVFCGMNSALAVRRVISHR